MSSPAEEFLQQGPSAFLEQPDFLDRGVIAPDVKVEDHPDYFKIAVGIAAALVVLRLLVKAEFAKESPKTPEEIREASARIYKKVLPSWLRASVPAIAQAYRLGSTQSISYAELESMATSYAEELGGYVHETSIEALTEGFNAQVNSGWSESLAWARAREAYGLDAQQMKSYVKGLASFSKEGYVTEPVPAAARAAVDRAFLYRADRLGTNEAFKASQVGRTMVWLSLEASGQLPEGMMKKWVTAADERVCEVCGPLDQMVVKLHERFEVAGLRFYAPGVHPNCRCEVELVYPEYEDVVKAMRTREGEWDERNRNQDGEFATREARKLPDRPPRERVRERVKEQEKVAENLSFLEKEDLSFLENVDLSWLDKVQTKDKENLSFLTNENVKEDLSFLENTRTKIIMRNHLKGSGGVERHSSNAWIACPPALLEALGKEEMDLYNIGDTIDFNEVLDDPVTGETHKVGGFSVPQNDNVFDTVDDNPAFDEAFEVYNHEELGFVAAANKQAKDARKDRVKTISNYHAIQDVEGMDEELEGVRQALSNKTSQELEETVLLAMRDPDAQIDGGDNLSDPNWMAKATASQIAHEILAAYRDEADRHNLDYRDRPNATMAWRRAVRRFQESGSKNLINIQEEYDDLLKEGSSTIQHRVILFETNDWYGEEAPDPSSEIGLTKTKLQGKYTILRTRTLPTLPPSVWQEDLADSTSEVLIVEIALDRAGV